MTTKERAEAQSQLTSVAARRVTWEAARDIANMRAAHKYIGFKDDIAKMFRELGAEFEAKRKAASDEQDTLLKQLGMR